MNEFLPQDRNDLPNLPLKTRISKFWKFWFSNSSLQNQEKNDGSLWKGNSYYVGLLDFWPP